MSTVTDTEEVIVKITNENHPNMSSTIGGDMELSPPERKSAGNDARREQETIRQDRHLE